MFRATCAIETPDVVSSRVGTGRARGRRCILATDGIHDRVGWASAARPPPCSSPAAPACSPRSTRPGRRRRLIDRDRLDHDRPPARRSSCSSSRCTAWAIYAPPRARSWLGSRAVVIWGGIAFPVVVAHGPPRLRPGARRRHGAGRPPSRRSASTSSASNGGGASTISARTAAPTIVSANEVRIPTGRPVEFVLTSADVIHSFWVPESRRQARHDPRPREPPRRCRRSGPASIAASAPNIAARSTR